MPAGIFVLFALLVAAGVIGSYIVKRKRQEAIHQVAARLGLSYSPSDPFGIDGRYPFTLFLRGEGRGCENVLTGTYKGHDLTAFDYWYYTTSSDSQGRTSRTYYRFSCAMGSIDAACPHLVVSKEDFLTRVAGHLSFHDIEFESEDFNKAWYVKSADKKFANDLIDQRMMQWLMYAGTAWSYEVYGNMVLCYSKRLRPPDIERLAGALDGFRDHVPSVVSSLYPAR